MADGITLENFQAEHEGHNTDINQEILLWELVILPLQSFLIGTFKAEITHQILDKKRAHGRAQ